MAKRKSDFDKWFLLNWKKFFIIILLWILFVVLHNLIYALSGLEDAFFFTLATIVIVYFIISIVYTSVKRGKGK